MKIWTKKGDIANTEYRVYPLNIIKNYGLTTLFYILCLSYPLMALAILINL